MSVIDLLRNCHLCKGLDRRELDELVGIASISHVRKGEMLFLEGDPAAGFYILLSGSVRIYKASPDGREYTLHRIAPGQMFAEAAIFGGEIYPANCAAMEDSVAAFFPRGPLTELIRTSPDMSLKMIAALSGFIREFNQQIEDLSLKDVPARLASHLLRKTKQSGTTQVALEMTKSELARSLGTIGETLSRSLGKMRDLGIIRVNGQIITVLDPVRLRTIADGEKI